MFGNKFLFWLNIDGEDRYPTGMKLTEFVLRVHVSNCDNDQNTFI